MLSLAASSGAVSELEAWAVCGVACSPGVPDPLHGDWEDLSLAVLTCEDSGDLNVGHAVSVPLYVAPLWRRVPLELQAHGFLRDTVTRSDRSR